MKLQFPAGSDVALVEITGNRKNCEPAHVRIRFPGGDLEVTRATDDDKPAYWVHIRVNRLDHCDGDPSECEMARIVTARIDASDTETGSTKVDASPFKNPSIYHLAVRVERE